MKFTEYFLIESIDYSQYPKGATVELIKDLKQAYPDRWSGINHRLPPIGSRGKIIGKQFVEPPPDGSFLIRFDRFVQPIAVGTSVIRVVQPQKINETVQPQGNVRKWLISNGYFVHATDTLEKLKSILEAGIRPGTQMSDGRGQGIESGPFVLVYPKESVTGQSVNYRIGDLLNTRVKSKPIAVIFDDGHFCDKPPIEELEQRVKKLADLYDKAKGTRSEDRAWRVYDNASVEWLNALDNPNYCSKKGDDFYKDVVAIVNPYQIPTYMMDFDDSIDEFKFKLPNSE